MESQAAAGDDKQPSTTQTLGANKTTTMDTTGEHLLDGLGEQLGTNDSPGTANADEDDNKLASQLQQLTQASGLTKNKKLFPQKLWDLIHDDKYNFCLRWSDDGQLVYLNRDEFEDSYLKTSENQFHTQKSISFVRQMNMYGFRKVDDCYYENDNFKRNCNHLLKNMIRKHPAKTHQSLHQHNNHLVSGMDTNSFQTPYPSFPSTLPQSTSPTNQQQQLVANSLSSCNSFASINSSHLSNDFNNCDDMLVNPPQTANLQSMYNDRQKELIQVLLSQQQIQQQLLLQQSNTQHPRDLTNVISGNKKSSQNQHLNSQQDLINLNAFYALVSSINSNIYQAQGPNNSIAASDINKLSTNKNRPLKRSVDSLLLDSNNNSGEARECGQDQFSKRIKIIDDSTGSEEDNFRRVINKYAKNLVTQVALAMDAQVDTLVIAQASRYTEQFVETLFDTAQVIARHSNCSKLADNGFDDYVHVRQERKDTRHNKETERSNINLSDLTSALKLLPSKFLNLLQ